MKEKLVDISERIYSAKEDLKDLLETFDENTKVEDSTALGDLDTDIDELIELKDKLMEHIIE